MQRWLVNLTVFFLSGLSSGTLQAAAEAVTVKRFHAEPFRAVVINGPINVKIIGQAKQPQLMLAGAASSFNFIYAAVKANVLYLGLQPGAPAGANYAAAEIQVPELNQLEYSGSGNVIGVNLTGRLSVASNGVGMLALLGKDLNLQDLKITHSADLHILGIKSDSLAIDDRGTGKVNLGGDMALHTLNYASTGPLSIEWINSADVTLTGSGRGQIFLAGKADQITATLKNNVSLDAQYLHANKGFISTNTGAHADVWTKYNLSAQASPDSSIYYYHDSQMVAGYMTPSGVVLRMTGIDTINR